MGTALKHREISQYRIADSVIIKINLPANFQLITQVSGKRIQTEDYIILLKNINISVHCLSIQPHQLPYFTIWHLRTNLQCQCLQQFHQLVRFSYRIQSKDILIKITICQLFQNQLFISLIGHNFRIITIHQSMRNHPLLFQQVGMLHQLAKWQWIHLILPFPPRKRFIQFGSQFKRRTSGCDELDLLYLVSDEFQFYSYISNALRLINNHIFLLTNDCP